MDFRILTCKKTPAGQGGSFFLRAVSETVLAAAASEFALELIDAAGGIDKALFTGVCRMGVCRNIARNDAVFDAVDDFFFLGGKRRRREELTSRGNVAEANKINGRMDVFLHNDLSFSHKKLTLTRFITRVCFIDNVNATAATNDLAVRVASLERLE